MITRKSRLTSTGTTEYFAEKKATPVPVIKREYLDGDVRMYETECGRHFKADLFDQNFKTQQTPLKPKGYKGSNACSRLAALEG